MSSTFTARMNAESLSGAVLLLYAAVYLIATYAIPASTANVIVGPAILPAFVGFGLLGVSLLLIAKGMTSGGETDEAATDGSVASMTEETEEKQDPRKLLVVTGLLLGYIVLFLPLGYVGSTFLFLALTGMYLDRAHPVRNLVYAVVFSVGIYYLFSQVLDVFLPVSPLGI